MNLTYQVLSSPSQISKYKNSIKQHMMSLSKEDREFRFFGGSEGNVDDWIEKITTDRPIKHIILLVLDKDRVVAVADIAHSAEKSIPEIAISVSKDVRKLLVKADTEKSSLVEDPKGVKLTEWLITALLDIAKTSNFTGVQYSTMLNNVPMVNLGRKLGFTHKWVEGGLKGEMEFQGDMQ